MASMSDHATTTASADLPVVSRSPYKRLRGCVVATGRRHLGVSLKRCFPVDTFRAVHRARRRLAPNRYVDGDPFAVFEADPHAIEASVRARSPKRPQWGRLVDGHWDQDLESFDERLVSRAISQRFEEGRDWTDTDLLEAFSRDLRRFGAAWDYHSMDGFEQRCAEIDRLYDRILSEGYRTQASLGFTPLDEINVDVDRDGNLLWRCYGQHRLAIAKLLELDRIPVIVPRRHPDGVGDAPLDECDPSSGAYS